MRVQRYNLILIYASLGGEKGVPGNSPMPGPLRYSGNWQIAVDGHLHPERRTHCEKGVKIGKFCRKSYFFIILFAYVHEKHYFCTRNCKVQIAKHAFGKEVATVDTALLNRKSNSCLRSPKKLKFPGTPTTRNIIFII